MLLQRDTQLMESGEQIVLRHAAPCAQTQIYQVRRIESMGAEYMLAGCCRAQDLEILEDGVRLPTLSAAAQPPRHHVHLSPRRCMVDKTGPASPPLQDNSR